MNQNKISSRLKTIIKSACAAAVLPILFIYIMIAKPDYTIMNGLAHIVLPVASWVGDVITWPIRAVGSTIDNIRELSNLRTENEELRVRLDDAIRNKKICEVAIAAIIIPTGTYHQRIAWSRKFENHIVSVGNCSCDPTCSKTSWIEGIA